MNQRIKNDLQVAALFIAFLFVVAMMLLLSSCSHKNYEHVVRDTLIIERLDSVIVNMRDVSVDVPVPQIKLEQWVPIDTLSILDNGLYQSIVEVVDGQIHHTLKPVDGATLPATVTVADTTHVTATTTHTSHTEQEKQVIQEKVPWWTRVKSSIGGWVVALILIIILISLVIYKIKKIPP